MATINIILFRTYKFILKDEKLAVSPPPSNQILYTVSGRNSEARHQSSVAQYISRFDLEHIYFRTELPKKICASENTYSPYVIT
jgi:hypothetical protein